MASESEAAEEEAAKIALCPCEGGMRLNWALRSRERYQQLRAAYQDEKEALGQSISRMVNGAWLTKSEAAQNTSFRFEVVRRDACMRMRMSPCSAPASVACTEPCLTPKKKRV